MYEDRMPTDVFHVEYDVRCWAIALYFVEVPGDMKRDCVRIYSM